MKARKFRQGEGKDKKFDLIDKKIEMSQMSAFTGMASKMEVQQSANLAHILQDIENDKKYLNTNMDREGLIKELLEYKKFALQQYDQIRLLKVEIMKVKKIAAQ